MAPAESRAGPGNEPPALVTDSDGEFTIEVPGEGRDSPAGRALSLLMVFAAACSVGSLAWAWNSRPAVLWPPDAAVGAWFLLLAGIGGAFDRAIAVAGRIRAGLGRRFVLPPEADRLVECERQPFVYSCERRRWVPGGFAFRRLAHRAGETGHLYIEGMRDPAVREGDDRRYRLALASALREDAALSRWVTAADLSRLDELGREVAGRLGLPFTPGRARLVVLRHGAGSGSGVRPAAFGPPGAVRFNPPARRSVGSAPAGAAACGRPRRAEAAFATGMRVAVACLWAGFILYIGALSGSPLAVPFVMAAGGAGVAAAVAAGSASPRGGARKRRPKPPPGLSS